MVMNCVVYQCSNRRTPGPEGHPKLLSFFRFPQNKEKRKAWIEAVKRRADWEPTQNSRICSEHFVEGVHSDNPKAINYRPTIFSHEDIEMEGNKRKRKRDLKPVKRFCSIDIQKRLNTPQVANTGWVSILTKKEIEIKQEPAILTNSELMHSNAASASDEEVAENEILIEKDQTDVTNLMEMHLNAVNPATSPSTGVNLIIQPTTKMTENHCPISSIDQVKIKQEDTSMDITLDKEIPSDNHIDSLLAQNSLLKEENERLMAELKLHVWNVEKIWDNDEKTKFYTGLPTYAKFLWLFNHLKPKAEQALQKSDIKQEKDDREMAATGSLYLIDQLLAVLMRLRLGLYSQDLCDRFRISEQTFSKYFSTWICLLHKELKFMNPFPSRKIIDQSMPECFKLIYPSTRIILGCTEILIHHASSHFKQTPTVTNYNPHITVKFLVGITPSGVISFVSEGVGGSRVSDRQITKDSGVLNLLEGNDAVMVDKGFTIRDLVEKKNCCLIIPPLGSPQNYTEEQATEAHEIDNLRINVEKSIDRVKNFHILEGILPLAITAFTNEIFQVCCWLTNFYEPLVK